MIVDMGKKTTISVIVTVYNQEKYIGKCIRSIIEQDFKDIEIIIVNDGSTDKSLKKCQKYAKKDNRIIIIDKSNEGLVSFTRKKGFLKAKGEYICFVDGDDYLARNALSNLYEIARSHNVDMVTGRPEAVGDNWGIIKRKSDVTSMADRLINNDELLSLIYSARLYIGYRFAIPIWGRLYRRTCVLNAMENDSAVLFPPCNFEDWLFNFAIAPYVGSLWNTNKIVYKYRFGGVTDKGFLALSEGGGYYIDLRFKRSIQNNYTQTLPSLFSFFCDFLILHIINLKHFKLKSENQINSFVQHELSNREIVLWARENVDRSNLSSQFEDAVFANDVRMVMNIIEEKMKDAQRHYTKIRILKIYQKLMDSVGQIEEFFR